MRGPALEPAALWRYGAQTFGVTAYPEWGLTMLTAEEIRVWVERYFTRENAVLWIAGADVPAGLKLKLPSGAPPTPAGVHIGVAGDAGLLLGFDDQRGTDRDRAPEHGRERL